MYLSNDIRDALQKSFHDHGFKDVEVIKAEEGDPDQEPVKIKEFALINDCDKNLLLFCCTRLYIKE